MFGGLSYNYCKFEIHIVRQQKKFVFILKIHKIISVEGNKDVPENQTSA